jgi:starch synthase (maltosyl-transferring)
MGDRAGGREGGHDAVHPTSALLEDFDAFVHRANELGLEVALDFALQVAPDHPWAEMHKEWFTTRADGTIAYARTRPRSTRTSTRSTSTTTPDGIYRESLRVLRHWMDHGVRIFRVDNPHTKPVAFWEWLLGQVRTSDPDVLFLPRRSRSRR